MTGTEQLPHHAPSGEVVLPTMRAVVCCYAPGDYRLETVPVPKPGPLEVLTRVQAVGICMGDIKTFHGAPSIWGDAIQPAWLKAPVIPGHEFIGQIVGLGAGAAQKRGLPIGARVIAEQIVPCWACRYCHRGEYWMCERHDIFGFQSNVNGATSSSKRRATRRWSIWACR